MTGSGRKWSLNTGCCNSLQIFVTRNRQGHHFTGRFTAQCQGKNDTHWRECPTLIWPDGIILIPIYQLRHEEAYQWIPSMVSRIRVYSAQYSPQGHFARRMVDSKTCFMYSNIWFIRRIKLKKEARIRLIRSIRRAGSTAGRPAGVRRYRCAGRSPLSWWMYGRGSPGPLSGSLSVCIARLHNCGGSCGE